MLVKAYCNIRFRHKAIALISMHRVQMPGSSTFKTVFLEIICVNWLIRYLKNELPNPLEFFIELKQMKRNK